MWDFISCLLFGAAAVCFALGLYCVGSIVWHWWTFDRFE